MNEQNTDQPIYKVFKATDYDKQIKYEQIMITKCSNILMKFSNLIEQNPESIKLMDNKILNSVEIALNWSSEMLKTRDINIQPDVLSRDPSTGLRRIVNELEKTGRNNNDVLERYNYLNIGISFPGMVKKQARSIIKGVQKKSNNPQLIEKLELIKNKIEEVPNFKEFYAQALIILSNSKELFEIAKEYIPKRFIPPLNMVSLIENTFSKADINIETLDQTAKNLGKSLNKTIHQITSNNPVKFIDYLKNNFTKEEKDNIRLSLIESIESRDIDNIKTALSRKLGKESSEYFLPGNHEKFKTKINEIYSSIKTSPDIDNAYGKLGIEGRRLLREIILSNYPEKHKEYIEIKAEKKEKVGIKEHKKDRSEMIHK